MTPPAVRLTAISKRFGAVQANDAVDLTVAAGAIHGIIGENGAGKSTLVSILSGHYTADSGEIALFGKPVKLATSADAIALGIGMVHQHFMLVPNFTVLENLMLGLAKAPFLAESRADVRERLARIEEDYGLSVDPDMVVERLPVGLQQRVEIIKALIGGGRILILDEPTGVLTPDETDRLFESLKVLKSKGVTILLITHKLREIMAITDTVSVMRRGRMVAHTATADTDRASLAELMVGRSVELVTNTRSRAAGEVALAVRDLSAEDETGKGRLHAISFDLRAGEIVGVAGVAGNGQSELLAVLAGLTPPSGGSFAFAGRTVSAAAPADPHLMRRLGLAHVPEDRRREGLVMAFQMLENAVLGYLRFARGARRWLLEKRRMRERCDGLMRRFDVRPPDPRLRAAGFSGGNQQKLVLAREHGAAPTVLLVGQPTRGVDIGAIEFIHRELLALRDKGCAILLVSVELDEILALSDRVMAMNAGRIVGILDAADADRQSVGLMMAGVDRAANSDRAAMGRAGMGHAGMGHAAGDER
ncbi:ABC transporter ATP-binding protein [Acuticoccus sp. 2012]|uniref:ABC transporter ATP-binding protein n=1 Tax=Acuticoccus mangrovi TaxID=2796142 RepID=A0A934IHX1_9HYPH|nr:ABC transporter ATP-binding protein [Acuticoccus mangrovi]MBJ3776778.1 ABC transporter ATP-binding protein [Acuticoccus mangrovi]